MLKDSCEPDVAPASIYSALRLYNVVCVVTATDCDDPTEVNRYIHSAARLLSHGTMTRQVVKCRS